MEEPAIDGPDGAWFIRLAGRGRFVSLKLTNERMANRNVPANWEAPSTASFIQAFRECSETRAYPLEFRHTFVLFVF